MHKVDMHDVTKKTQKNKEKAPSPRNIFYVLYVVIPSSRHHILSSYMPSICKRLGIEGKKEREREKARMWPTGGVILIYLVKGVAMLYRAVGAQREPNVMHIYTPVRHGSSVPSCIR